MALMHSDERSSIAFDAGKAFHLQGGLERAADWYRRGLGPGGSYARGRVKTEFLQGLVLALGELERWGDIDLEIERFVAAYPHQENEALLLRGYASWRRGFVPDVENLAVGTSGNDLDRYLLLEYRNARREPEDVLLGAVRAELGRSSDSTPMLLSLEAELLGRLGRSEEARAAATRGRELAGAAKAEDFVVRAFFDLIAERYARLWVKPV
jgi:hypothetical protein